MGRPQLTLLSERSQLSSKRGSARRRRGAKNKLPSLTILRWSNPDSHAISSTLSYRIIQGLAKQRMEQMRQWRDVTVAVSNFVRSGGDIPARGGLRRLPNRRAVIIRRDESRALQKAKRCCRDPGDEQQRPKNFAQSIHRRSNRCQQRRIIKYASSRLHVFVLARNEQPKARIPIMRALQTASIPRSGASSKIRRD